MHYRLLNLFVLIFMIACNTKTDVQRKSYKWPEGVKPPIAATKAFQRTLHGDTVTDNYYWMVDYFKKGADSTKVVDYLKAENEYLDTMMSGTKKFQEQLFCRNERQDKRKRRKRTFI